MKGEGSLEANETDTLNQAQIAAKDVDWQQVVQNGGPPCFHVEDGVRFCLRSARWEGHGLSAPGHPYVSLERLLATCAHESLVEIDRLSEKLRRWGLDLSASLDALDEKDTEIEAVMDRLARHVSDNEARKVL